MNYSKNGTNLTIAFKALRRKGYFAKQNFLCCQSCAWAEIAEMGYDDKAVFYHAQDYDNYKDGQDFFLAWDGDGNEIVETLNKYGVQTEWNGNDVKRIKVITSSIRKIGYSHLKKVSLTTLLALRREFQKDLIKFEGDEEAQEEIEYQLASLHCVMVDLAVRKLIEDDFE
jgi:hypothetical protein